MRGDTPQRLSRVSRGTPRDVSPMTRHYWGPSDPKGVGGKPSQRQAPLTIVRLTAGACLLLSLVSVVARGIPPPPPPPQNLSPGPRWAKHFTRRWDHRTFFSPRVTTKEKEKWLAGPWRKVGGKRKGRKEEGETRKPKRTMADLVVRKRRLWMSSRSDCATVRGGRIDTRYSQAPQCGRCKLTFCSRAARKTLEGGTNIIASRLLIAKHPTAGRNTNKRQG